MHKSGGDLAESRSKARRSTAARVREMLAPTSYAWTAMLVAVCLFVACVIYQPSFAAPSDWAALLGLASPFVVVGLAQAPVVLSGNGGLDLSVGPLAGFVNVVVATVLVPAGITSPFTLLPLALGIGCGVGLITGILIAYVRLPPIIATLSAYLILSGLATQILPQPGGSAPAWVVDLVGNVGPIPGALLVFAVLGLAWLALSRSAFTSNLLAVGGDDRAAYTAGINVAAVRTGAYVLSGLLAAVAGLLLTGIIHSGDPTIGPPYTITSITAVALGGLSLAGGRGGMLGAAAGGLVLFLIQSFLTVAHVSVFQMAIVDGLILILALAANGFIERWRRRAVEVPDVSQSAPA